MKNIFRSILIETIVLYLVSQATSGLFFEGGVKDVLITGVCLALATLLVRPIVNVLLLPINLITFGLFKWLSNALVLYLVDVVLNQFRVGNFAFAGFANEWITVPMYTTNSLILSYILFSFVIFFISSIFYWFVK
ncbi:MAG: phage holin family protein [Patescibacteria group bacterium]